MSDNNPTAPAPPADSISHPYGVVTSPPPAPEPTSSKGAITSTSHVLATIFRAHRDLDLPAPVHYRLDGRSIHLGFLAPVEVTAWQRHIGLPPAENGGHGEFGTVDFYADGGWCGASVVTLSCPTPKEVAVP